MRKCRPGANNNIRHTLEADDTSEALEMRPRLHEYVISAATVALDGQAHDRA